MQAPLHAWPAAKRLAQSTAQPFSIIDGHTTKIEHLKTTMVALQATVDRLEGLLPSNASADMVAMREQISSYSDAMTTSEKRRLDPTIRGNREPDASKLQKPLLRSPQEDLTTTVRLHWPHTPWVPSTDSHSPSRQSSAVLLEFQAPCLNRQRNRPTLCHQQQLHFLHNTIWAARPISSHLHMIMVFPSRRR